MQCTKHNINGEYCTHSAAANGQCLGAEGQHGMLGGTLGRMPCLQLIALGHAKHEARCAAEASAGRFLQTQRVRAKGTEKRRVGSDQQHALQRALKVLEAETHAMSIKCGAEGWSARVIKMRARVVHK